MGFIVAIPFISGFIESSAVPPPIFGIIISLISGVIVAIPFMTGSWEYSVLPPKSEQLLERFLRDPFGPFLPLREPLFLAPPHVFAFFPFPDSLRDLRRWPPA